MKAIRIVTLAVALGTVMTSVAGAQGQPEPAQQGQGGGMRRGGGMGGMILQGITLTDAQKAQVKAIREKYAPKMMEIRKTSQTTGTPPDRAKITELHTAQSAELRAILTADQQVIFDRNAAAMKARMADHKGSGKK